VILAEFVGVRIVLNFGTQRDIINICYIAVFHIRKKYDRIFFPLNLKRFYRHMPGIGASTPNGSASGFSTRSAVAAGFTSMLRECRVGTCIYLASLIIIVTHRD
jgi:hypothetical protein